MKWILENQEQLWAKLKELPLPPCLQWLNKEEYKEDISQFEKKTQELKPLDCYLDLETDIENLNKSECIVDSVNFEVGLIGPHSKHFSTLCLDDILSVK